MDARHDRDASQVYKTKVFDLPVAKNKDGTYKVKSGETVWTCFSSDFLLEAADVWRMDAWQMMQKRQDLHFFFITKRIHRLRSCLPPDWGEGYPNVSICCTVENQDRADYRLPILLQLPIAHKYIACEPLLGEIRLEQYLTSDIVQLVCGGESGANARPCHFEWILSLQQQCKAKGVSFQFRQTGANFVKDGILYRIPRKLQHTQARKAGLNYSCGREIIR